MRIIDNNGMFLRDDIIYNTETENAIEVDSPQGLWKPRWNGTVWEESLSLAEIEAIKAQTTPPEPTIEDRVTATETNVVTLQETIDVIFGGV